MTEPELKPCPFCGGKAKLMDAPDVWVECTSCGAQSRMCAMPETALERWNVRVTEEELARLENIALGSLIRKLEDIVRENEEIIKVAKERDHDGEGWE